MAGDLETERHRCEVRWCIRQGREWFDRYIAGHDGVRGVAKTRGEQAARRLVRDVKEQWARGNRGAAGDWRDT